MKPLGYLFVTIGFLAGSLIAVLNKLQVNWLWFSAALAIGIIGVVMIHIGEHRSKRSEHKLAANLRDIQSSLGRIVENMTQLNAKKQTIDPYDIRHHLDKLFTDDLTSFADARQSLTHVYSLQVYADVMSHFACGERYLNRVWSASADGYIDEITGYLDKAQAQFTEALNRVNELSV